MKKDFLFKYGLFFIATPLLSFILLNALVYSFFIVGTGETDFRKWNQPAEYAICRTDDGVYVDRKLVKGGTNVVSGYIAVAVIVGFIGTVLSTIAVIQLAKETEREDAE